MTTDEALLEKSAAVSVRRFGSQQSERALLAESTPISKINLGAKRLREGALNGARLVSGTALTGTSGPRRRPRPGSLTLLEGAVRWHEE